jgi:hypothetical protein
VDERKDPLAGRSPWGSRQPKFERIVTDGPGRYFLVGRLESGKTISVQLTAAEPPPPPAPEDAA